MLNQPVEIMEVDAVLDIGKERGKAAVQLAIYPANHRKTDWVLDTEDQDSDCPAPGSFIRGAGQKIGCWHL